MRQEPGHLGVSRDVRHRIGAFDPIVGGVSVGGRSSIIWPEGDGGEDVGGAEKQGEPTGYRRCQIAGGRDTGHVGSPSLVVSGQVVIDRSRNLWGYGRNIECCGSPWDLSTRNELCVTNGTGRSLKSRPSHGRSPKSYPIFRTSHTFLPTRCCLVTLSRALDWIHVDISNLCHGSSQLAVTFVSVQKPRVVIGAQQRSI